MPESGELGDSRNRLGRVGLRLSAWCYARCGDTVVTLRYAVRTQYAVRYVEAPRVAVHKDWSDSSATPNWTTLFSQSTPRRSDGERQVGLR